MELPYALLNAVEKLAEGLSSAQLSQAARTLSERYRDTARSGQPLLSDRTEAAAYAITRMPATYGAVWTALDWTLEQAELELSSLLDVGAGTGAATWAASERLALSSITCMEAESSMKERGRALMENTDLSGAKWVSGDLLRDTLPCKADLVIASYVLNEIRDSDRPAVLKKLWDAAGKLLLIVEPGTPAGFEQLRTIRQWAEEQGAFIAAPCPDCKNCPVPKGEDWCHFTCRIPRSRLHRQLKGGDAPYEDEKFSYLALCREPVTPCQNRVLRHPVIETGRITLSLCSASGRDTVILRKKSPDYKKARKLHCGDALTLEGK